MPPARITAFTPSASHYHGRDARLIRLRPIGPSAGTSEVATIGERAAASLRSIAWLPTACFAAAALAAFVLIFHVGRGSFFHGDDWSMIVFRRDLSPATLLRPHVDHLVVTQVVVFELLRSLAHWHYDVYREVMVLLHLAVATGVFFFARRRVGPWLALALVLPLLFLGSKPTGFFWAGVMGNVASLAAGIAAFVLLDRIEASTLNRVGVCALLSGSLASFTWGVAFALAAGAALVINRATRRMVWVAAAPLAAYVIWRLAYPAHGFSLDNVRETPIFVVDSAAGAFGAASGLGVDWGRLIALGTIVLLGRRYLQRGRPSAVEIAALTLPIFLWVITGLGRAAPDGAASALDPRYVYAGVPVVLMAFAVLAAKSEPSRLLTGAVIALSLTGLIGNLIALRGDGAGTRDEANSVRAYMGALEVARPLLRPNFGLAQVAPGKDISPLIGNFMPGSYWREARKVGGDPVDIRILPGLAPDKRQIVDDVLVRAVRLRLSPPTSNPVRPHCKEIAPRTRTDIRLPRAGLSFGAGPQPTDIWVRRYADAPAARSIGTLLPGQAAALVPRSDRSRLPWFVRIASAAPVRVCRP